MLICSSNIRSSSEAHSKDQFARELFLDSLTSSYSPHLWSQNPFCTLNLIGNWHMFMRWRHRFIFSATWLCSEVYLMNFFQETAWCWKPSVVLWFPVKPGMCAQSISLGRPIEWAPSQQVLETSIRCSTSLALLLSLSESHIETLKFYL